jgi:hypothetical protein
MGASGVIKRKTKLLFLPTKRQARILIAASILMLLGLFTCIGWAREHQIELRDADNQPVANVYVGYYHVIDRFSTSHSTQRVIPGKLLRSSEDGIVVIPNRVIAKSPLDSDPRLVIKLIYAPEFLVASPVDTYSRGMPGAVVTGKGRGIIRLMDVSGDPDRWLRSLESLRSNVLSEHNPDRSHRSRESNIKVSTAEHRELAAALLQEFQLFMTRYHDQPRAYPKDEDTHHWTADERTARLEQLRTLFEREPTYGVLLDRTWREDIARLRAITDMK